MKFSMCIGGLTYNVDCLTEQFYENHGKSFSCPYSDTAFNITVTEDNLSSFPYYDSNASVYENETVFLLDSVIKHCLDYNRMIIHGAAISYRGSGYLFIAPSGTGKTTHIGLWKKYLDDVEIINGDKPMLIFGDEITVSGTPWNGKENFGGNISAPLRAIVALKQGSVNSFAKMNSTDCVVALLRQCFCSVDKVYGAKVIAYIEKIVNTVPVFSLECDISRQAFDTCYSGLKSSLESSGQLFGK